MFIGLVLDVLYSIKVVAQVLPGKKWNCKTVKVGVEFWECWRLCVQVVALNQNWH